MDERAKNKRKLRDLEQGQDDGDHSDPGEAFEPVEGVEAEKPGEGLRRRRPENNSKKQRLEEGGEGDDDMASAAGSMEQTPKQSKKEQKKASKKEKKAELKAERAEDQATPIAKDKAAAGPRNPSDTPATGKKQKAKKAKADATPSKQQHRLAADEDQEPRVQGASIDDAPSRQNDEGAGDESLSESGDGSPTFDMGEADDSVDDAPADPASAATSISSAVAPSEKPKQIKIPADTTALKARLAAKIAALRAARKADGPDGKPIRTRQELIESRRAKQVQRKAHKKELRQQAKLEEQRRREEALASNSPGAMSPAVELDESTGNFSFGRVAFGDGSHMSHDLSYVLSQGKKKGPSDPKTALLKVQNQKKRLGELDAEKRGEIAEKEAWLTARRRIEGDKIRDDESLLKKAVKRKEAAKKKSEKAWKERTQGVGKAQKERQQKREDNLRKRRDEKLAGKAGKKKGAGGAAKKKKGGRPGFEGSLGVGGRRR